MKIGIKRRGVWGVKRTSLGAKIEKVEKKEVLGKEMIAVYFRGIEGVGIISLAPKELEMISERLKTKMPALPKKKSVKKRLR